MRRVLIPALACLSLAGPALAEDRELVHDGTIRSYEIHGPATGPAPALLVLHGGGGRGWQIRRHAEFTLAEQGWVTIYPDALDRLWNDGRHALAGGPLRRTDDVGFLRRLLGGLAAEGRIDPARIYVTGISNGGAMTQRLLCEAPELVAGAAVVAMNFPVGLDCPDGPAVPMLFLLGTEDPLVPYAGGPVSVGRRDRGAVRPAADTFAFYARRNRCAGTRETLLPDTDPGDGTRVRRVEHTGCTRPLVAYVIEGGGHTWPGRAPPLLIRAFVGRASRDIDGTRVIQELFTNLAEAPRDRT